MQMGNWRDGEALCESPLKIGSCTPSQFSSGSWFVAVVVDVDGKQEVELDFVRLSRSAWKA
tara:strand:- start:1432 stop:1614 length:183 start_codon:yes stop_codon:yes gene_type:complete